MIVVEFFGGPGSGKTTTASAVWSLFKQNGYGGVEFCREYAQDLIYAGQTHRLQNQAFVTAGQCQKYLDLEHAGALLVFSDSSMLLAEIYGAEQPGAAELGRRLDAEFQIIRIFVRRVKPFQKFGRLQTEEEAKALDAPIRALAHFDLEVSGDGEGIAQVFHYLRTLQSVRALLGEQ